MWGPDDRAVTPGNAEPIAADGFPVASGNLEPSRRYGVSAEVQVAEIIRGGDAKIQSVFATEESADRSDLLPPTNRYLDRVTVGPFESVGEGRRHVQRITGQINEGGGVMVSTQPGRTTKSPKLREEVRIAKEAGAIGCTFYNYGLLREEQLGFIGSALR